MEFSVFKKGIDDLRKINYSGRIAFHITSEPLLFPDLHIYLRYAKTNLIGAWFQLLTNGKKLDIYSADQLIQSGLNEITVNWYMEDIREPLPNKFHDIKTQVIEKYYNKNNILPGFGPPDDKTKQVFRYNIFKRNQTEIISNQAGSAPNKERLLKGNFLGFCHSPMTDFHITTDGRVSKCSKDVMFFDPMGNIQKDSILEVWNSDRFQDLRKMLLRNHRKYNAMCLGCDYFGLKESLKSESSFLYKKVHNLLASIVYHNEY